MASDSRSSRWRAWSRVKPKSRCIASSRVTAAGAGGGVGSVAIAGMVNAATVTVANATVPAIRAASLRFI